jgi:hypothetical protein
MTGVGKSNGSKHERVIRVSPSKLRNAIRQQHGRPDAYAAVARDASKWASVAKQDVYRLATSEEGAGTHLGKFLAIARALNVTPNELTDKPFDDPRPRDERAYLNAMSALASLWPGGRLSEGGHTLPVAGVIVLRQLCNLAAWRRTFGFRGDISEDEFVRFARAIRDAMKIVWKDAPAAPKRRFPRARAVRDLKTLLQIPLVRRKRRRQAIEPIWTRPDEPTQGQVHSTVTYSEKTGVRRS